VKDWQKKAIRDAAKSFIPFQPALRSLKRSVVPYQDNRENSMLALRQGIEQIKTLRAAGITINGTVLEFGSGWIPLIPFIFYICGATKIILTDVERLMDSRTIKIAYNLICENIPLISEQLCMAKIDIVERMNKFDYEYLVPWNSRKTRDNSLDIIISRAVFEHIPKKSVSEFFSEFRRIIKPAGAMCHFIDNSDHSEHLDKSLSRLNFLQFDSNDTWWRVICKNPQNYQNRLRHSDYVALLEESGWSIAQAIGEPDPGALQDLSSLDLAHEFRSKEPVDLAILTSCFVARPNSSSVKNA
jgi:cyclopropane fatty-acyl-phospholipid synthase-like methyltransferase